MSWRESREALKAGDFRKLFEAFSVGAGELATPVVPGEAHLAGKADRRAERKAEVDPLDLRLDALEREIARRRGLAA